MTVRVRRSQLRSQYYLACLRCPLNKRSSVKQNIWQWQCGWRFVYVVDVDQFYIQSIKLLMGYTWYTYLEWIKIFEDCLNWVYACQINNNYRDDDSLNIISTNILMFNIKVICHYRIQFFDNISDGTFGVYNSCQCKPTNCMGLFLKIWDSSRVGS
jgi:hypothetical protein